MSRGKAVCRAVRGALVAADSRVGLSDWSSRVEAVWALVFRALP